MTDSQKRKYYYTDVPRLGNVAVSRHAQDRMDEHGISQAMFERALLEPDGADVIEPGGIRWRQKDGVRVVIIDRPEPFKGAKLVKTVMRAGMQEQARK
jgi:hypothetical protein